MALWLCSCTEVWSKNRPGNESLPSEGRGEEEEGSEVRLRGSCGRQGAGQMQQHGAHSCGEQLSAVTCLMLDQGHKAPSASHG